MYKCTKRDLHVSKPYSTQIKIVLVSFANGITKNHPTRLKGSACICGRWTKFLKL